MIALEGNVINKYKLIHAYFKRENIDFSESDKYFEMPMKDLRELIQSKYDINIVDWKHMQKAKKIGHAETEHEIQVKVCKYCKENKIGHFSVPNGFVHNNDDKLATIKYINYMKSEGLYPGVPDMVILPGNGKIGFLEIKTNKGKLSEQQIKWQEYLKNNSYPVKTCYGLGECLDFINSLL